MEISPATGTVTLLFTDVEGATRLLRELGDSYAEAIADHQRLLRRAFALHGGREIDTQGDAFFVAFDSAGEAVAAAADALRALEATRVRVRVGIHTGEPEPGERGYVGLAVHRAARICAAANGGQIVISHATRSVVGDGELSGTMIRDLGEHSLKDFEQAEHLYQVIVDGVAADLRPIRTLEVQEAPPSPFGAAESDLAAALDDALSLGLVAARGSAVSATDARRVDALARAIESRDRLAESRSHLAVQMRDVESRSEELRSALFEIRLGHQSRNDVLEQLIGLHADTEDATVALTLALEQVSVPVKSRARHRRLLTIGRRRWDAKTPLETIADVKTRRYEPRRRGF
jgi:class 3 adenylate cyclase